MKEQITPQDIFTAYYQADWNYQYCDRYSQFQEGKQSVSRYQRLRDNFYAQGGTLEDLIQYGQEFNSSKETDLKILFPNVRISRLYPNGINPNEEN